MPRPCPVCAASAATPAFRAAAMALGPGPLAPADTYDYVRCPACEATYVDPLPEPARLDFYYHSPHYHFVLPGEARRPSRLRRWQTRLARPAPATPGRHLDYACGPGGYLDYTREAGFVTTGVELDDATAAAARGRGHRVVLATDLEAEPRHTYDFVSLLHALEHVAEPVRLLQRLAALLSPRGRMLVEVPWLGWELRAFGTDFAMLQAPVHLQFFSERTMARAAELANLRIERGRDLLLTPVHVTWSLLNAACRRLGRELPMQAKIKLSTLALPFTLAPAAVLIALGAGGPVRQFWLAPAAGSPGTDP